MAAVPKAMTREYLEGLDLPGVKAHAIRLKIKQDGVGWSTCCSKTGSKADIIRAIIDSSSGCGSVIGSGSGNGSDVGGGRIANANINAIGRTSSGRLASVLTARLADAVILARSAGEFRDFADLKKRVPGIGPRYIEALEAAGFRVECRQSRAAATEQSAEDIVNLRMNVQPLKDQVFRFHGGLDKYTLLKKKEVEKLTPEVDHEWEIQVLNQAYAGAIAGLRETRGAQNTLKQIVNSERNLNVTTHVVNQAKKGPFMRVVNEYKFRGGYQGSPSLEDLRCIPRHLQESGHWARIEVAMVVSYEALDRHADDLRDDAARRLVKRVTSQMQGMIEQMGIGQ